MEGNPPTRDKSSPYKKALRQTVGASPDGIHTYFLRESTGNQSVLCMHFKSSCK